MRELERERRDCEREGMRGEKGVRGENESEREGERGETAIGAERRARERGRRAMAWESRGTLAQPDAPFIKAGLCGSREARFGELISLAESHEHPAAGSRGRCRRQRFISGETKGELLGSR